MNRTSSSDDDHTPTTSGAASNTPAFRLALIDLTTAQIIIEIGDPADSIDVPTPPRQSSPSCARWSTRRRMARTRAHHLGDGTATA